MEEYVWSNSREPACHTRGTVYLIEVTLKSLKLQRVINISSTYCSLIISDLFLLGPFFVSFKDHLKIYETKKPIQKHKCKSCSLSFYNIHNHLSKSFPCQNSYFWRRAFNFLDSRAFLRWYEFSKITRKWWFGYLFS